MATTPTQHDQAVALDNIHIPDNVRPLDQAHVDALAGSIKLQGVLVPLVVRPSGDSYELVAGFHRLAAAHKAGLTQVPVVVRDATTEDADRAVENIARKQLNAYEEARAVKAMLDRGLTEDGAAQALGWPKARVTARVKILALPDRAQQMIGDGIIALSCVDQLRAIGNVAPNLLQAVIAFLDDGNQWAAERLVREPGWVLDSAVKYGDKATFAAYLETVNSRTIETLRLGKKTDELLAEAERLHRRVDAHAYGPPRISFEETDIDQARAAGVLIEFDRGRPIIVDRSLYRELVKAAIKRTVAQLHVKADAVAAATKAQRSTAPTNPLLAAQRERDRQLRELSDQAHGVNLDLGSSLLHGLAIVDPASMDVARFFVYALLGEDFDNSPYTQSGERIQRLAMGGIRLIIEELRSDVTKTRKDGTPGRLRIDYGTEPGAALKWLWKFVDGAGTPGELYGRALVVIAAQQYASRLVLPTSKRGYPIRWSSHKNRAAKALKTLAGPHLPASLSKLEQAVKRASSDYDKAAAPRPPKTPAAAADVAVADEHTDVGEQVLDAGASDDVDVDELDGAGA